MSPMESLLIISQRIDIFLLVLARVSGIMQTAPLFSSQRIPAIIRVGLAALIALVVVIVRREPGTEVASLFHLAMMIATEFLLGAILGFAVNLVVVAVQIAGQLIDMQMGFGIVNVLDPQTGIQVPLIGNFQYLLALLVLLGMDGHHLIISAIVKSYDFVPLGGMKIDATVTAFLVKLFCGMWVSAMKIGLPVTAALLVSDLALGIVARTVPQMNVFIVGLPVKIALGFVLLLVVVAWYIWLVGELLQEAFSQVDLLLRIIGVG